MSHPVPQLPILNLAFYQFVRIPADSLPDWRKVFRIECAQRGLRGTILISAEGINASIAGPVAQAQSFMKWIDEQEPFRNLDHKLSYSETIPFQHLFVKIKKEIIPLGLDSIVPEKQTGHRIAAEELRRWLDENRDFLLVDTRNRFEVEAGTFEKAVDLGLKNFREFAQKIDELPSDAKSKPVVMFCTGGIRCEKATALALQKGFSDVYQLDGGILRYFERVGSAHYRGACFVFDERVTVAPESAS
jgi:UPF0176 protein